MFLVVHVGVWYDHRLGVLGVAKIIMSMHVLCVCGVLVCTKVFVRV